MHMFIYHGTRPAEFLRPARPSLSLTGPRQRSPALSLAHQDTAKP